MPIMTRGLTNMSLVYFVQNVAVMNETIIASHLAGVCIILFEQQQYDAI